MKKKWPILASVFFAGMFLGAGSSYFIFKSSFNKLADQASVIFEFLTVNGEAEVYLRSLKAIDRGTNDLQKYQRLARSSLTGYLHNVDRLREGANFPLPDSNTYEDVQEYLYPDGIIATKKRSLLDQTMIPMVREFIRQNEIPFDSNFTTNQISKWKFEFNKNRNGGQGYVRLQNRYAFEFFLKKDKAEIRRFKDVSVKTYYDLFFAPQEQIDAIKALNLKNKLNEKTAIELATKYFKLQGHKLEDFHVPECLQCGWGGTNLWEDHHLPYYGVEWYRKDVKMADVEQGFTRPLVRIEVSGITTNLISYSKSGMPVGSDF